MIVVEGMAEQKDGRGDTQYGYGVAGRQASQ